MTSLIGISGKIGCGKSTLATMLSERLGLRVMSFGSLLKDEVSRLFEFPREWCDTPEGKRRKVRSPLMWRRMGAPDVATVRQLLQYWGTDVVRKNEPDHWVLAMSRLMERTGYGVIIDDVRFVNEARMIYSRGGILVRLDPYPGWDPGQDATHASETALDEWVFWAVRLAPAKGELALVADAVVDAVRANMGGM